MEEQILPFPLPNDFSDKNSYQEAINKWKERTEVVSLNKNLTNQTSAFFRRPQFNEQDAKYKFGYPKSVDRLDIFKNVVNGTVPENVKYWVYEKSQWAVTQVSRPPVPDMYDNYADFEEDYKVWFQEVNASFSTQLENSNDVLEMKNFGKKGQITRIPEEKVKERFENFHPSKVISSQNYPPIERINKKISITESAYVENNTFYQKISEKGCTKLSEMKFMELDYDYKMNTTTMNITPPSGVKSLLTYGPRSALRPFKALTITKVPENVLSYNLFLKIMDLDSEFTMMSDVICEKVIGFLYSNIFIKQEHPDFFRNERMLYNLAMICWRYHAIGHPPFTGHYRSADNVDPMLRQLWSYSLRIPTIVNIIKSVETFTKGKKIVSCFNTQKKALDQEFSAFIKKNKASIPALFNAIHNEDEGFITVDTLVALDSKDTIQYTSATRSFDFISMLNEHAPKALRFLEICITHSSALEILYLKSFTTWDCISPRDLTDDVLGLIYILFNVKLNLVPPGIFDSTEWIVIIISQLMQNVASRKHIASAKTAEKVISIFMKSAVSKKKKPKNWNQTLESLLGILTANISEEKSIECLELEINIVSHLFREPALAKHSLQFICRIGDPCYRIAHAAYKVLKTVALTNQDVFLNFFTTNRDTLKASFLIVGPATMLDVMKFLAAYIDKYLKEEQAFEVGFLSSPDRIPMDIMDMIQFLLECNLMPKKVVSNIKKINPRPPEVARNVGAMEKLMSVLAKRRTLMKFILIRSA